MRQAGTIDNEQQATRFADYLLARGISSKVLQESDGWGIWIQDESKVDGAKQELGNFLENPDDSRFSKASGVAREIRRREEKENKRARRNLIDAREVLSRPVAQAAPLTISLIILSIAVALLSNFADQNSGLVKYLWIAEYTPVGGRMIQWNGLSQIESGQIWRLVTPIIVHYDIWHLLFNMMMMYQLGRVVEAMMGTGKMTALVLAIAVGSNLAEYWINWQMIPLTFEIRPNPKFGGMSGVVYGLFGFIWLKARLDPLSGFFMPQQTVTILIIWLLLGTVGFLNMANVAHGMGLAIGAALGYSSAMYHTRWRWR